MPAKAAIVVCDSSVEAICVNECMDEYGVCVCEVEGGIRGIVCGIHVLSLRLRYLAIFGINELSTWLCER